MCQFFGPPCICICVWLLGNRKFERNASGLLEELYEVDANNSHKLLTRELKAWNRCSALELADEGEMMDFMKHDCCQTKLDTIWHGKIANYTSMWRVF